MTKQLLTHDHAELGANLSAALATLESGDATASFQRLDQFWGLLAIHIRAENVHLFPAMLHATQAPHHPATAPAKAEVRLAIARLRDDHDYFMKALTPIVKRLRSLANGGEPDTGTDLAEIRAKLQSIQSPVTDHNAFEESQVYPWLPSLLDETARGELASRVKADLENLPQRLRL